MTLSVNSRPHSAELTRIISTPEERNQSSLTKVVRSLFQNALLSRSGGSLVVGQTCLPSVKVSGKLCSFALRGLLISGPLSDLFSGCDSLSGINENSFLVS